MYKTINVSDFNNDFKIMNIENKFSYNGLNALYDYLEEYEEETGNKIELDVIALCIEFTEYEDIKEYLNNYNTDVEKEDYKDIEDFNEAVMEELNDKTIVIKVKGGRFIIQNY